MSRSLLDSYIEARTADVAVKPYWPVVRNGAFKGRTSGYWAGIGMGSTWGLIVGAAITAVLPLFDVAMTTGLAVKTMAAFTALGIVAGGTAGQIIGAAAGASASGNQEKERREKARELELEIRKNPPSEEEMRAAVAEFQRKREEKGFDRSRVYGLEDAHAQTGNWPEALSQMVNLKVMATSAVLGVAVGVVMAVGGQSIGVIEAMLGKGTDMATAAAMGATIGGISGCSFGFNFPAIFTSISALSGRILSGEIFERAKSPEPGLAPEKELNAAPQAEITEAPGRLQDFQSNRTVISVHELVPARAAQPLLQQGG